MAKGPAHEYATGQCEELLRARPPSGWHVRNQAPVTLASSEPDITVAHGDRGTFRTRHPSGREVALVVEVSETTLVTDRLKASVYARAGVPAYWLLNLTERCVEVYTEPDGEGYRSRRIAQIDDTLALTIESHECDGVPVAALLP